jgi:hypothetical protein
VVRSSAPEEGDSSLVFVQVAVDAAAVDVITDVVRLSTVAVDGLYVRREEMVAVGGAGEPSTVMMPDYLVPFMVDVAALARCSEPQALRPDEVTSYVLDQAGLLAAIKGRRRSHPGSSRHAVRGSAFRSICLTRSDLPHPLSSAHGTNSFGWRSLSRSSLSGVATSTAATSPSAAPTAMTTSAATNPVSNLTRSSACQCPSADSDSTR